MTSHSETELAWGRDDFLAACRISSSAAYRQFEGLLAALEDLTTRTPARRLLGEIEESLDRRTISENLGDYHFAFQQLPSSNHSGQALPLSLLLFPSVFVSEVWSKTFFEGLARLPDSTFSGKILAELGSGSGWISLALARRALPTKVYGLELNPRAVTCARINLYHNALDHQADPILDQEGLCLLDRVEFHASNLLTWIRQQDLKLDLVCGCIPQVLDPELETTTACSDEASDDLLHSLSNYTARQGYLEDQFGLGLIARALDEAVLSLQPNGQVLFNLGGRPGQQLLHQLFQRRGFEARELWKTRISQASDTDIMALAEIEEQSPHRFEFFMGPHGEEPIGARTARAYQESGGRIFHDLTVFEGRMRHPVPLQQLYGVLMRPEHESVRGSLDLSFEDDIIAEEKLHFLVQLSDLLMEQGSFPYEMTLGTVQMRRLFSNFLAGYLDIMISPECLAITPNLTSALNNVLTLFAPKLALVHPRLNHVCLQHENGKILECPAGVDLVCDLVEAVKPQVVITRLAAHEMINREPFLRLMEVTGRAGVRLVVDLSAAIELTSTPEVHGALQVLAEGPVPLHTTIFFNLEKNRVYPDLEICCLLSENSDLLTALARAAEVTYSRTPVMPQYYFTALLGDLLAFRLEPLDGAKHELRRLPRSEAETAHGVSKARFAESCRQAFKHPALTADRFSLSPETLRLDYGENALPSPTFVKSCLFEVMVNKASQSSEKLLASEIATQLRRRFGLTTGKNASTMSNFHFGLGVAPLFAALAAACAREPGTFLFPCGSYGYFVAAVQFFGGRSLQIETRAENGFKLMPEDLERALSQVQRPWLYLNGPIVNPTGSLYTANEIADLLAVAARHRARVVLDVLFSGLEFEDVEPWDLDSVLDQHLLDLVVLGGVSKELAAGGLRFGFAHSKSPVMSRILSKTTLAAPHRTILDAVRQIYYHLNHPTTEVREAMSAQRVLLKQNAKKLSKTLVETGWDPLEPKGGLFLAAKPSQYLGRTVYVPTPEGEKKYQLNSENLPEALFYANDLLINNSIWTGLPEYCRFVYSVPEADLEESFHRLQGFRDRVMGS